MKDIARARIKILNKLPFYGRLALLLIPEETSSIPTMATDGEYLLYNKNFVKSLTTDEVIGCIVHEVSHCALGHLWRREDRIPHIWNYAADYVVNHLVEESGYKLPAGSLTNYEYNDKSSEQVYDILKKTMKVVHLSNCVCVTNHKFWEKGFDGKSEGKGSEKDKQKQGEKKDGEGNGKGEKTEDKAKMTKSEEQAAKEHREKVKKMWEAAVEEAVDKYRGSAPAAMQRAVEESKSKEDWRQILSNYLVTSKADFNMLRRDRRTYSWDFYLPDMQDDEKLENIVVAIDTSGSIDSKTLNKFLSEVKGILNLYKNVRGWLIDCDCEIGKVVDINEARKIKTFYGGGGTSHVPVFKEIRKRSLNPKVLICFTDLYTEFPNEKPSYPVLWLVPKDEGYYNVKKDVPFGRVIPMYKN